MIDYSRLSDDALNVEIASRIKWEGGPFWFDHDYLHDKAATRDALVEMPDAILEHSAFDMRQWVASWLINRENQHLRGCGREYYGSLTPARAVWYAWLQWKDSKEANMSDNLTLETFLEQLYRVEFIENTPSEAHQARVKVIAIVEHMWELLEASQRALTRAMHENRIHQEALEQALDYIDQGMAAQAAVEDKLRELEGNNAE